MSYSIAAVAKKVNGNTPKKTNKSTLKDNGPKKKAFKMFPSTKKPRNCMPKEKCKVCATLELTVIPLQQCTLVLCVNNYSLWYMNVSIMIYLFLHNLQDQGIASSSLNKSRLTKMDDEMVQYDESDVCLSYIML